MKPRERCTARLKGSRSVDDRCQRSAGKERERLRRAIVAIVIALAGEGLVAQQPPGGIPALTPAQRNALAELTATVAPLVDAAATARDDVLAASFAVPRSDAAIRDRTEALRAAEHRLANARADAFARVQASPSRLTPDQVAAFTAIGGSFLRTGAGRGGNPPVTDAQRAALTRIAAAIAPLGDAVTNARANLVASSVAIPRDDRAIAAATDALGGAELALAHARADRVATLQASEAALSPYQIAALVVLGGTLRTTGLPFTEPDPPDFTDHAGFVQLFDGATLNGWDGNPKFWHVEDGAIVGESTVERPSGNSYLAYRGLDAHDFTLKLEIKVEGPGGSGIQYRSKTGLPWLANVPQELRPVNLDWMMTGPQADFWPASPVYTGQFYSENTPMRILAWRGQVVEGFGASRKRLLGTIGDRRALGDVVKPNDWNQYTVVARGGTFLHIINGQLMAVMIDDDPASSNNATGQIGIEIEAVTRVSVRNIWLKKLN
jgi:hypothetical protein